jgi:hypothetical protein
MQEQIVAQGQGSHVEMYHISHPNRRLYKMRNIKTHPHSVGKKEAPATQLAARPIVGTLKAAPLF